MTGRPHQVHFPCASDVAGSPAGGGLRHESETSPSAGAAE
jgi:hypothetical protein